MGNYSSGFYSDLREHQLDALNALIEVDRIFGENDIPYYLLAGSALGAVRHKGFIPWDDDIDIGIFCKDKERAYALLRDNLKNYQWIERSTDPKYPRLYGKVLSDHVGCIDVFIIVKTPDGKLRRRIQWAKRKILFKLYKAKIGYHNHNEVKTAGDRVKLFLAGALSVFFSESFINSAIEKNESRYEGTACAHYINLYSAYSMEKEMIKAEWLEEQTNVEFEGRRFPTVSNTHDYLTHLYGDYMTPPEEHECVLRHEELF